VKSCCIRGRTWVRPASSAQSAGPTSVSRFRQDSFGALREAYQTTRRYIQEDLCLLIHRCGICPPPAPVPQRSSFLPRSPNVTPAARHFIFVHFVKPFRPTRLTFSSLKLTSPLDTAVFWAEGSRRCGGTYQLNCQGRRVSQTREEHNQVASCPESRFTWVSSDSPGE
jgi:hypothetical protein